MRRESRGWIVVGLALVALGLAAGCKGKGGDQSKDGKGLRVVSLKLTPAEARAGDELTASFEISNPAGASSKPEIEWYVNDKKADETGKNFDTGGKKSGDKIFFKVRGVDPGSGLAGDWKTSNTVVLGAINGPALKGVTIEPNPLLAGNSARAVIDFGDLDPDSVTGIYYRWYVNRERIGETEGEELGRQQLDPKNFSRGDNIKVEVCTDGQFARPNVWSAQKTVANSPPKFTVDPYFEIEGKVAVIRFEAQDPDGDTLTATVTNSPPGASADTSEAGAIRVDCNRLATGSYPVSVSISDGNGATISFSTTINIP
jgi:hypothetical protein